MLLTARTILYVTSKDGTNEMSLLNFSNAIKGGLDLEEVERLERKRRAKHEVQHLMSNMTPEQAEKVVEMLRGNEELMELFDDYA
jgi:hypothetical protein